MSAPKPAVRKPIGRVGLMSVLIAPHVTEKSSQGSQQHNQYAFRVRRDATRTDVRRAVELMFEVKVRDVQIVNQHGKRRRFGGRLGRTQDWKKAYVRLPEGQSIDYERSADQAGKR
ncbi:MAG TPA: 50S ribosomal protein L23 [Steroidobacteraceae bacterium]|nr:50S ribosomal protein L23 [Steroidobacteraceae bacterium]